MTPTPWVCTKCDQRRTYEAQAREIAALKKHPVYEGKIADLPKWQPTIILDEGDEP